MYYCTGTYTIYLRAKPKLLLLHFRYRYIWVQCAEWTQLIFYPLNYNWIINSPWIIMKIIVDVFVWRYFFLFLPSHVVSKRALVGFFRAVCMWPIPHLLIVICLSSSDVFIVFLQFNFQNIKNEHNLLHELIGNSFYDFPCSDLLPAVWRLRNTVLF